MKSLTTGCVMADPPTHGAREAAGDAAGSVLTLAVEKSELPGRTPLLPARHISGIVIGHLVAVSPTDGAVVDHPENSAGTPLAALSTAALAATDVGSEVALAFERGDPARPIVLGLIHRSDAPARADAYCHVADALRDAGITVDEERLTLTARREIVLQCGEASITLTRAGKALVRGTYLLSRSSGVNRIRGGSVQIN